MGRQTVNLLTRLRHSRRVDPRTDTPTLFAFLDSHPSYSSTEDNNNDTDSIKTTSSSSSLSNLSLEQRQSPSMLACRANWILVVLLQLIIILIAMQGPFVEWTPLSGFRLVPFPLQVEVEENEDWNIPTCFCGILVILDESLVECQSRSPTNSP